MPLIRGKSCSDEGLTLETSANTLYAVQHIHINLTLIHCKLLRCLMSPRIQFFTKLTATLFTVVSS